MPVGTALRSYVPVGLRLPLAGIFLVLGVLAPAFLGPVAFCNPIAAPVTPAATAPAPAAFFATALRFCALRIRACAARFSAAAFTSSANLRVDFTLPFGLGAIGFLFFARPGAAIFGLAFGTVDVFLLEGGAFFVLAPCPDKRLIATCSGDLSFTFALGEPSALRTDEGGFAFLICVALGFLMTLTLPKAFFSLLRIAANSLLPALPARITVPPGINIRATSPIADAAVLSPAA